MITNAFFIDFTNERKKWLDKLHEAQNALGKLYSALPPGIVLRNQKDNRHAILEIVENRKEYLSIKGRIIRRDGGLKKRSQHLYQWAQEWIPVSYEETLQFCHSCKHLKSNVKSETEVDYYCIKYQEGIGNLGRFGTKQNYPREDKIDCYENDLTT